MIVEPDALIMPVVMNGPQRKIVEDATGATPKGYDRGVGARSTPWSNVTMMMTPLDV